MNFKKLFSKTNIMFVAILCIVLFAGYYLGNMSQEKDVEVEKEEEMQNEEEMVEMEEGREMEVEVGERSEEGSGEEPRETHYEDFEQLGIEVPENYSKELRYVIIFDEDGNNIGNQHYTGVKLDPDEEIKGLPHEHYARFSEEMLVEMLGKDYYSKLGFIQLDSKGEPFFNETEYLKSKQEENILD